VIVSVGECALFAEAYRQPLIGMLKELVQRMKESGLPPESDAMPVDQGIGKALPDAKIR